MSAILLATDGTEDARLAPERAIERVANRDAPSDLISVLDQRRVDEPGLRSAALATIDATSRAAGRVTELPEHAERRRVTVEGDTSDGIRHDTTLEYAGKVGATVIGLGDDGDNVTPFRGVGQKTPDVADREMDVDGARAR